MSKPYAAAADRAAPPAQSRLRRTWPMFAIFGLCIAPVLAAVAVYLNDAWRPTDTTNYGTLVLPQRSVPEPADLTLTSLDGKPFDLRSLKSQWILLSVGEGQCAEECAKKLFITRQTHASTGKNVDRIERVWLITDNDPVSQELLTAYPGVHMLRVDPSQAQAFLAGAKAENHIWLIDPLNNLMMRFPEDADPFKLRKDVGRLLFASQIG